VHFAFCTLDRIEYSVFARVRSMPNTVLTASWYNIFFFENIRICSIFFFIHKGTFDLKSISIQVDLDFSRKMGLILKIFFYRVDRMCFLSTKTIWDLYFRNYYLNIGPPFSGHNPIQSPLYQPKHALLLGVRRGTHTIFAIRPLSLLDLNQIFFFCTQYVFLTPS